ncbi:Fic/DOC family protein [Cryobacterium sp. 10I5]|uniref:Fic/DOC family protein n=1 Tax=Cryobacterium sp. 10I5 TaxID=3048581 RepID=UPI002B22D03D|nr:Fic family protein [Cryobacterium sp. 10I5]MEB0267765.1 Fic family protein [Cryobacterium sp. 10I5]
MASEPFDTSYRDFSSTLYPLKETGGVPVMRNAWGIREKALLQQVEYVVAERVRDSIQTGVVPIERTFDLAHARQLHTAMFTELYPNWAGVVRPHGIVKGDHAFAAPNQIEQYWRNTAEAIRNADLPGMGREEFVSTVAYVYANINQAHFGREGNGRTGKLFLDQMAEQSAFTLNYSLIEKGLWNEHSKRSRPATGYLAVRPAELVACSTRSRSTGRSRRRPRSFRSRRSCSGSSTCTNAISRRVPR